ncbi:MAG: hypothetical protein ACP5T6_03855 [Candidatus Micrarchaeia archaeon]
MNSVKNDIKIEVATNKDTKSVTSLYKKLYRGNEKQKFFRSDARPD